MKNIFESKVSGEIIDRINKLNPNSKPAWGKMSVGQMLAHCKVTYEMIFEDKHKKPNAFVRFMLKTFIKEMIVNEKPYKQNSITSSAFRIIEDKNFEVEKKRLIDYISQTQQLGEAYFDNKESHSFGVLTKKEWNNLLYKHLDHHLMQFEV